MDTVKRRYSVVEGKNELGRDGPSRPEKVTVETGCYAISFRKSATCWAMDFTRSTSGAGFTLV
jgi:hypothetical protein